MNRAGLDILVLVCPIHDCLNPVKIAQNGKSVQPSSFRWVMNPCDASALETALAVRDRAAGTRVRALSMSPPEGERVLRDCLAAGADEAVRLWDDSLEGSDPYATARVLAAAIRLFPADLVLAGAKRGDLEQGQVGPMVAEMLGLPQVTAAREIHWQPGGRDLQAVKRAAGCVIRLSCPLPALVTMEKGSALRYPRLRGRKRAERASIRVLTPAQIGLGPEATGTEGSLVEIERITPPKPSRRSALAASVSTMSTAARLQRILSGGLQGHKEGKIRECRDAASVEKVVEHMIKEKIVIL
mgnify:CR=1 FL=1